MQIKDVAGIKSWICAVFLYCFTTFAQANIQLAMEANHNPARQGETINIAITVTNSGNSATDFVTLRMQWIGAYLSNISDSLLSGGGSCAGTCSGNEFVNWTLGVMNPGETRTFTLPATIWGGTPFGTVLPFVAESFEDGIKQGETTVNVVVEDSPPFEIAVDENVNPATPGEEIIYTISYSNTGTVSATQSNLSFPIPAGTTFVSTADGETPSGGVINWNLGTIPAQSGDEKKVRVTVNNDVSAGSILEVNAAEITGLVNFLPEASTAMAITRVENNVPLLLAVEHNPDPVKPGETVSTALTVSNVSGGQLFGVTLQMRWIGAFSNNMSDSLISDGGTCFGTCSGNEFVSWTLGVMNAGDTRTVTLPPQIWGGTPVGKLLTFKTTVTEDSRNLVEQSHTVRVQSTPPLDIAVDEDMNPVSPGKDITYTITYSNRGLSSTTQAGLHFPIPVGTSFVSATDGVTPSEGIVSWNLGTVPAQSGSEKKVRVTVNNNLSQGSILEVDAAEFSGLVNSLPQKASTMAVTRVESNTTFLLGFELNPDPVKPGETLNNLLTVTNTSNSQLFGVTLRMRWISEYLNNMSDALISDGGTCSGTCSGNEFVNWTLGTINAGETRTVTLPPTVWGGTPAGELLTFNTTVTEDSRKLVEQSHTVRVHPTPPFDISVDEDINPVAPGPGEDLIYTITYSNRGTVNAQQSKLSFPIPAGTRFVSATDGVMPVDGILNWNLGTVQALSGSEKKVRVIINHDSTQGSLLEIDAAEITGLVNSLPHTSSATAVSHVDNSTPLLLGIGQTPDPVQPGERLDTVLTVTNITAGQLFGVDLKIRWLGDFLNNLSDSAIPDGGSCFGTCSGNEFVFWTLGTMNASETRNLTLPPVVWGGTPVGELLTFNSFVIEDGFSQSISSNTVFVGSNFTSVSNPPIGTDSDGDNWPDIADSCTLVANEDQIDTDGDGIGNKCDCDLNQDGFCGGPDFNLFIGCFNKSTNGDPTCEAADMNGDNFVGGPDFNLFIGGFNKAPGPSGL